MAQDRVIVGTVVHSVAILIFVHDDIQAPVKAVLDPIRAKIGHGPDT
jgi:hypothetical protein